MCRNRRAFTLLELLVVILIFSLFAYLLVPENMAKSKDVDEFSGLNNSLSMALHTAQKNEKKCAVRGFVGGDVVQVGEKVYSLPDTVSNIKINGNAVYGLDFNFYAYENGNCDYVEILFNDGKKVFTNSLLCSFRTEGL